MGLADRFTRSSNPLMNKAMHSNTLDGTFIGAQEVMTVQGAVNKTFLLFGLMMVTAVVGFLMPSNLLLMGGAIGGLIFALVASFKPQQATWAAPAYALFEGLFVGTLTRIYMTAFDGIVFNAITLTMAILFTMLFLYKSQIIVVTRKLQMGIMMATGAVALVYLVNLVLMMFGIRMPMLHDAGPIGIGISVVIIAIAAFNLLLDFKFIEDGASQRLPKYMEWVGGMGLLITLVWLYIEILRLLSKLQRD